MTGTGTIDEPYIVDTWEELISLPHTANQYVECNFSEVDLGVLQRGGYVDTIELWGIIDFKGAVIKRLYSMAANAVKIPNGACSINNVTFENVYWQPIQNGANMSVFLFGYNSTTSSYPSISNVSINGQFIGNHPMAAIACSVSNYLPTSGNFLNKMDMSQCAMNIIADTTADFHAVYLRTGNTAKNCDLVLDVRSASGDVVTTTLFNSRIRGSFIVDEGNSVFVCGESSSYNVIDLESAAITGASAGICIYNSTKATSSASGFVGVSEEHFYDADYLKSVRFPAKAKVIV